MRYKVNRCNEIGFKLLLIIVLLLVTWQALSPQPIDQTRMINDKLGHALVFLLLAGIADHAFALTRFGLKTFFSLLLSGITIACIQYYVPTRSFSLLDMLADASGLLIYGIIIRYVIIREPSTKSSTEITE